MPQCLKPGCLSPAWTKGLCSRHYQERWRLRHGFKPRVNAELEPRERAKSEESTAVSLASCEYKLVEAREAYRNASSISSRLHWGGRARELEAQLADLKARKGVQE